MPHSAVSDLGLYCLHMTHKKDARLVCVKMVLLRAHNICFCINICFGCSKEQTH